MELYRHYAQGMFCVAMRMVRNEADAEDLTQEAFIKAFRKLDQFQGQVSFGAWLKRIVVNRCLDYLKARKQYFVDLEEHRLQPVTDQTDWEVNYPVGPEAVRAAIDALPDKYREVVQLYLIEGYDHSEIAEILEIKETTCRTRLMRGKAYILEQFNDNNHVAES